MQSTTFMKWIFFAALFFPTLSVQAEGIDFFQGTWAEALEEAEKQDKIIFVDAYAVWCGPCKKMSKEVFTDDRVGDFYNKNFVNVKMDMERGEGLEFRKKYPVSAFPTLFYIDYTNGEIVLQTKGARNVDGFIDLGKSALGKIDRTHLYAEAYEQGDRSPELMLNYIKALNRAGKSSLKVANDYLRDQNNLSTPQNLKILLEATTEADSRIFGLLEEHKAEVVAVTGENEVAERILDACRATARKAVEFESRDLLEEAIDKLKKHDREKAKIFAMQQEMAFTLAMDQGEEYLDAAGKYIKKVVSDDPESLSNIAQTLIVRFKDIDGASETAEELAREAAAQANTYDYYLVYAEILNRNGKKAEAMQAARQSKELAEAVDQSAVKRVEMFIRQLDS